MSSEKPSPVSSNLSDISETLTREVSQEELITLLQKTITKLDIIVQKINDQSPNTLPKKDTINALINSTEIIASSLETKPQIVNLNPEEEDETINEEEDWEDALLSTETSTTSEIDEPTSDVEATQKGGLSSVKSPFSFLKHLSKGTIAAIVALVIIGILSTSYVLFKPSFPDFEIGKRPPEPPQPQVVETPPQLELPELPQPVKNIPSSPPKLTPEQSLIAAIQQEVTQLTRQYPDDLIGRIEANFLGSRLRVTLGNKWYDLSPEEQDKLANTILERSRNLDFRKLEMLDEKGDLIARSPVVGNDIIILEHSTNQIPRL
ncbi:hypothetical protein [Crocosphaera sp.]|uniref:hypothetical protein n=1 Tax=Crocosphaera sp. TaxID=2729996 RepID=UPI003F1F1739